MVVLISIPTLEWVILLITSHIKSRRIYSTTHPQRWYGRAEWRHDITSIIRNIRTTTGEKKIQLYCTTTYTMYNTTRTKKTSYCCLVSLLGVIQSNQLNSTQLNSRHSPVPVFVPKSNHPARLKKKQSLNSDWLPHQWNQIIRILTMSLLPVHKQQWPEHSHDYYYPSPVVFSEFELELEIEFAADSDHPNNHTILICCFYCCCCCCRCSIFFFFFSSSFPTCFAMTEPGMTALSDSPCCYCIVLVLCCSLLF